MIDEDLFKNAVTIAAAFVANGDIRSDDNYKEDSRSMLLLQELIPNLYHTLRIAKDAISDRVDRA